MKHRQQNPVLHPICRKTLPFLLGCVGLMLISCAPKAEVQRRYFWPIGNPEPKIEYVRFFRSDRDVTKGFDSAFAEAVLGVEEPKALFGKPYDVASDGKGRLFVTDLAKQQVLILDLKNKTIQPLEQGEGDPPMATPFGLAVDASGDLYIADSTRAAVFVFSSQGRLLNVFGKDLLVRPVGLDVDDDRGLVYVADPGKQQVAVFTTKGDYLRAIGGEGKDSGSFNVPLDVAVGHGGELFVLDALNARVQVFSPQGDYLRKFGERGTALGSFGLAKGIAVDRSGHVYVTNATGHRFIIFDQQGRYLLTVGGRSVQSGTGIAPGGMNLPAGIDADANDAIWVVDGLNRMVHQFQYLNEAYLDKHPVRPEDLLLPPGMRSR